MLSTLARSTFAATAVTALLLAPTTAAQAATTVVVVTPENLQGWGISPAPNNTTAAFTAGPSTSGDGAVRFGPIAAAPPAGKFIIQRLVTLPTDTLGGIGYDFYIDPAATNKAPEQFYLNVYVDSAQDGTPPASFYECRYDYVAATGVDGWNALSVTPATVATTTTAREGLACGDSLDDLPPGSSAFLIALNGGDTSASDAGIAGGFDTVRIASAGNTTTYDFEPVPVPACTTAPTPGRTGTAGGDVLRGTPGADRVDLRAGNDVADLLGGNDCLLGGPGRDVLRGGDGNDEVSGGADADTIDAGAGADVVDAGAGRDVVAAGAGDDTVIVADGEVDVVDCGAGTDTVRADAADVLRNCETRV